MKYLNWLVNSKEKRITWILFFLYGILLFACVHQVILGYQMMSFNQVNDLFLLADSGVVYNTLFGRAIVNALDYGISLGWCFATMRWYDWLFIVLSVYLYISKLNQPFHRMKYKLILCLGCLLLLYISLAAMAITALSSLTTLQAVHTINTIGNILLYGSFGIIIIIGIQIYQFIKEFA